MNQDLIFVLLSIFDEMPTAGLIVLAFLLQTVCRTVSQSSYVCVKVGCLLLLTGCFAYEYQRIEPYELGEFIQIGVRCVCVALIFMPFGNIIAWFWSNLANKYFVWRFYVAAANRKSREKAEEKRLKREEERRLRELLENEPEPIDASILFEQSMKSAKNDFDRECQVVESFKDLDEFERQGAIDQARAKMTRRIHEIMQGEI